MISLSMILIIALACGLVGAHLFVIHCWLGSEAKQKAAPVAAPLAHPADVRLVPA